MRLRRQANFKVFVALACVAIPTFGNAQQQPSPPQDIWSLRLGAKAAELAALDFGDYACGTNGGPPSVVLEDFSEFLRCPRDAYGLREVYFRYDDEFEYVARALRNNALIARYAGTRVFTFPVVLSALFDDLGILRGLRVVTDPKVDVQQRMTSYGLARYAQLRFGEDGWSCVDRPPENGEHPFGGNFSKQDCRKVLPDGRVVLTQARLFEKAGQSVIDPLTHEVRQGLFESSGRLEIYDSTVRLRD